MRSSGHVHEQDSRRHDLGCQWLQAGGFRVFRRSLQVAPQFADGVRPGLADT
ncbi:MAG: hypothetical protein JO121_22985 [Deltaproteobacteria bacterium]|nr:hypothetical protein [Deltaproteobacteria bacterium]